MNNRSSFLFFLCSVAVVFFTSCGDDDKQDIDLEAALIGQWEVVTFEEYDCPDPEDDFYNDCTDGGGAGCWIYEFQGDGKFKAILSSSSSDEGTYRIIENSVIEIDREYLYEMYLFTIDGDEMTFVLDVEDAQSCSRRKVLQRVD